MNSFAYFNSVPTFYNLLLKLIFIAQKAKCSMHKDERNACNSGNLHEDLITVLSTIPNTDMKLGKVCCHFRSLIPVRLISV